MDKIVITSGQRTASQPEGLRGLFYPGRMREEFVHPSVKAISAARRRIPLMGTGDLLKNNLLAFLLCAISASTLSAQRAPVNLGTAGNFVILSKTGITDVPPSPITGNVGTSPITGAAIGLSCTEVTGTIFAVDAAGPPCAVASPLTLTPAIGDLQTAYTDAAGRTIPDFTELFTGNISGKTLLPGLYKWSTSVSVDSTGVTLSGGPNAVWIFQIAGDVTLANTARVTLAGGARAVNIFWQVGGPTGVTLGTTSSFAGNILSAKQVIMNTGATLIGRALALTQVTLQSTTVTSPGTLVGGLPVVIPPSVTSTVPASAAFGVPIGSKLTATFSEPMDPTTITPLTFTLQNGVIPVPGTVTYTGSTATFTPTGNLTPGTQYIATITNGARDPAGVAMAFNYIWTFTTGVALDTTPPTVTSTVPATGATNVPVGNALAATFSEAMDPLSISSATFTLQQGATAIAGVVSYAGVTATFKPTGNLAPNVLFTATITTGAKDLAGNALVSNYVWTFTTGATPDTTPPTVSSTVPATGATNVPVGNAMAATFSEAMDPLSISSATFTLQQGATPIAGVVSYAGVTATFKPTGNLAPNVLFTATITTGAKDLAGNALVSNYVWTFTTGATPDTTPPTVSSTVPATGATNVPVGNALAATFSEAMDPLSISSASFTLQQGATAIAGVVSYAGVTATFKPTGNLAPNVLFTATITTGAKDLAGNALVSNYVWTFTTGATPDTTPPTVSSTVPGSGATNVPVGNALAATFSEAMDPLSISSTTFTLQQGATAIAGIVSYAGVTAMFKPTGNLAPNVPFTATITTGAKDLAGNALVSNYVWTFTTGATPDTTPPTVSSTVPANGDTNVPVGNALAATFSEAMDPLSISSATFTLLQGATMIPGIVSYAGVTAMFKPTGNLAPNVPFTATITTGAKDLAGNALVSNYVWTFTTGATPDTTPPTVSSTVPANGDTNVPVGNALAATFSEAMDPLSISSATFTLLQGATMIPGTVSYAGVTATFKSASNLAPNTSFTATITTGAKDLAGNALVSNYVWTFTTPANPLVTPPTVITPPIVISTVPANGDTNVATGNALAATFSKAMDPLTITTATFNLRQGSTPIAGTVSYTGLTGTFKPSTSLAPNAVFTATITTGAKDLAGNALVSSYVWTFTTGTASDTTLPVVISTAPVNGATMVTTTANLVATFNKAMNPLTITTATFILRQGATLVTGTVAYAGISATFRPGISLLPNTLYTATITRAASDLAGNSLAGDYVWSFTTGASAGQPSVCLANFAVLAGSAIIGTGSTAITGDIGVSPGTSVTGFPPGTLQGTMHAGDPVAAQGMADFSAAYGDAVARSVGPVFVAGNLGGQTFTAGLYRSTSSLEISSGDLTIDAKGDVNAVFIFQMASTLTTTAGRRVILTGGAQAFNIFWQVGTSATLGANSVFKGSILADQSVTMNAGATLDGRLAARTGSVTLQSNSVVSPPPAIAGGGIYDAASDARTVAAGSIATVFGNNFSSSLTSSTTYPLLTTLGGSSFQIGTQAAPLFMSSCGQVNLQIPWESVGQTQLPVIATVGGLVSTQEPVTLAPFAPGIFALNQVGTGQGAVQIAPTPQLAAPQGPGARPVQRGEYIAIFCTGLGPVSNQPATGAAALGDPLSSTSTLPTVTIGGISAQVTFSGLAPGFAGLYQVNAVVPDAALSGDSVNLEITIGGIKSNTVTIAIQ